MDSRAPVIVGVGQRVGREVLEAPVQGEPRGRAGRVRWMHDLHRVEPA